MNSKPPNPKSVSPSNLGRMRDEVVGEVKGIAKDAGTKVAKEPKQILDSILGGKSKTDGEKTDPLEQGISDDVQQDPQAQTIQKQQLLNKKKQDDEKKKVELMRLHRQRLKEEEDYFQMKKKQEEQEKQVEEQKEEEEEKQEIVQLQRERQKSEQLTRQVAGRQGSKEQGRGKKF